MCIRDRKVIAQGYLLSWFQQYFFSLKVEDAEGFIVNEKDGHRIVQSDNCLLYTSHNSLLIRLLLAERSKFGFNARLQQSLEGIIHRFTHQRLSLIHILRW